MALCGRNEDRSSVSSVSRHGKVGQGLLNKDSIGLIVKRAAKRAGYDSSTLAGHSLRAGLATQAALNGATELTIMKQTGHRSLTMLRDTFVTAICGAIMRLRVWDCEASLYA